MGIDGSRGVIQNLPQLCRAAVHQGGRGSPVAHKLLDQIHRHGYESIKNQVRTQLRFADPDLMIVRVQDALWLSICGEEPLPALDSWLTNICQQEIETVQQLPFACRDLLHTAGMEPAAQSKLAELHMYSYDRVLAWMKQHVFDGNGEDLVSRVYVKGLIWIGGDHRLIPFDMFFARLCWQIRIDYIRTLYEASGQPRRPIGGVAGEAQLARFMDPVTPEDEIERRELASWLAQALAALRDAKPKEYEIFILHEVGSIKDCDIAAQFKLTRDQVRGARERAQRFLRQWWTDHNGPSFTD